MKTNATPEIKKELDFCMKKFMEQQKKQKEAPKIQEVKKEPAFKKVQIEEDSEDSDDAEELRRQEEEKNKKKKRFAEETLS